MIVQVGEIVSATVNDGCSKSGLNFFSFLTSDLPSSQIKNVVQAGNVKSIYLFVVKYVCCVREDCGGGG